MKTKRNRRENFRRAAVAVEFAFVAPFLISTALGIIELTRAYDAQNLLETAAREGARFASMDREGMLQEGQSTNDKLIQDVKNFLGSSGLDTADIQVSITDADSPGSTFDLDDPANDLRLFKVDIAIPYSSISYTPVSPSHDFAMSASIVFRNGRATLSQ
ncbi:MAG: TadE/TadG family type IV pilus assembly protein [Bythopirellula sp.]|nr:TadE/TadG family type IV pilus assembly protein [Bythopirellula sp.]